MDFLEPRKAYHRTHSDDFELVPPEPNKDSASLRTKSSFQIGFSNTIRDQSPLLRSDDDPVFQEPSPFSRKSLWSIKPPFSIWPTSLYGWRTGAITAALVATISLFINFIVLIWLGARGNHSSLVEVYTGDCRKVEIMDVRVHLAINVLSTLLLGGSNYCMQCLAAPTRRDVDRAHAKGKFLDVGVPSVRNLSSVPRYKVLLWWALGISSVPLHLMYNSAFYKSLAANDYGIYFVTPDFVNGQIVGAINYTALNPSSSYSSSYNTDPSKIHTSIVSNPDFWEHLDKTSCI